MNLWFILPAFLTMASALALWTASRLIIWARVPQNIAGAISLLSEALIMLGFLCQTVTSNYQSILIWNYISLVGLWLLIPSWLCFVMLFTGYSGYVLKWVNKVSLSLFGLVSFILFIVYQTPAISHWISIPKGLVIFGPFMLLSQSFGWIGSLLVILGVLEGGVSAALLFGLLKKLQRSYQIQIGILIAAVLAVCIALVMQVFNWNPIAPVSPIMIAFLPSCILKSWVFYSLKVGKEETGIRERIVESMRGCVIVLDSHQRVTYVNPSASRILDIDASQALRKPISEVVPEITPYLYSKDTQAPDQATNPDSIEIGEMVYSIGLSVIRDWKGEPAGQTLVLHNITDRERLEQTLQTRATELARSGAFTQALSLVAARVAASAEVNQVYQTMSTELHQIGIEFMVALNQPGETGFAIEYFSLNSTLLRQLEHLTGIPTKGFKLPGFVEMNRLEGIKKGSAIYFPHILQPIQKMVSKLSKIFEHPIMNAVGISYETAGYIIPLTTQHENMGIFIVWGPSIYPDDQSALSSFAAQVSAALQKARLIADLEDLKSFNEGIVQGVAEAIVIFDGAGYVTFANPAASRLIGRPTQELIGQSWRCFIPQTDQENINNIMDHLGEQNVTGLEITLQRNNGSTIPALLNAQPRVIKGQLESLLISLVDIEQRVVAEQKLRASNQEKEVLLKEIHHRVKNNLQVISSLLNLQSAQIKDPVTVQLFRESQNRVRAMALIHEKLYQSHDLARIDFKSYIQSLSSYLVRSFAAEARGVAFRLDVDAFELGIDQAIPCGLIISELISNSLKYAFPEERKGEVHIQFSQDGDHQFHLIVGDDGIGFPESVDYKNTSSLGLQLVNSLVSQLDGTVDLNRNGGTEFHISFRESE